MKNKTYLVASEGEHQTPTQTGGTKNNCALCFLSLLTPTIIRKNQSLFMDLVSFLHRREREEDKMVGVIKESGSLGQCGTRATKL